MKKYQRLFQEHRDALLHIAEVRRQIAAIERKAAEHEARGARAQELGRWSDAEAAYREAAAAYEPAQQLQEEAMEFMHWLTTEITDAYASCPFAATRRQGIDGFWSMANSILNN